MAKHDRMSHIGPNGQDVGKRLLASGYSFSIASENVGVGQATIEETVDGWKASPANSRNMLLANAKHIGIAYEKQARFAAQDLLGACDRRAIDRCGQPRGGKATVAIYSEGP